MQGDNTRNTHTKKKWTEPQGLKPLLKAALFYPPLCSLLNTLFSAFLRLLYFSSAVFFSLNGIRNVFLEAYLRIFFFPFFSADFVEKKKIVRLRVVSPHPTLSIFLVRSEKRALFFCSCFLHFSQAFPLFFFLCDLKSVELKAIKSLQRLLFFSFLLFFWEEKEGVDTSFLVSFVDIDAALCSSAPTICELTKAICCVQWF